MIFQAPRIAAIQHGDYREAVQLMDSGQPEPYFGMRSSVAALRELFHDVPHCVVSLDAPSFREQHGQGLWIGMPSPPLSKHVPATIATILWRRQILRELRTFQPTHVLLRNGNPWIASAVLHYCLRRNISVLVLLANIVSPWKGWHQRREFRDYIRSLNGPNVFLVGNHKRVAAQSLIDHGVNPTKVVAWDFAAPRHPSEYPPKSLRNHDTGSGEQPFRIVYAGAMIRQKGLSDLLDAVRLLHERSGTNIRLFAYGDGKDVQLFRLMAPVGMVHFAGRASNVEVFESMLQADAVCVPSRHEFTEGMPQTLTEALASRTPVVVSDHPVLKAALQDGEGVLFAESRNPESFASALQRIFSDPELYLRLSESTLRAYERVECRTTFGDLLRQWAEQSGIRSR